jgi:tetratricopeptide (TPR) repeat protein
MCEGDTNINKFRKGNLIMKEMSVNEAVKLLKSKSAPAISIYLKTDHKDRDGMSKVRANLASLYKTIEGLIVRTYDVRTKERLLGPLKNALSGLKLSQSKGGIAIYHNENFTGVVKVPTLVSDLAVAAESFHLKPMLRCAQLRKNYYLLAIRRSCADLYLVTAEEAKKVDRFDIARKREDQSSTKERDDSRAWFKKGQKVRKLKELNESMNLLNQQLALRCQGERIPLVLGGADQYQEAFRNVCSYVYLLEQGIAGDIEYMDEKGLTALSNHVIEQYYSEIDDSAIAMFQKAEATGLASSDLVEIAQAAARGQVQTLLIAEDRHIWGYLDREFGTVEVLRHKHDATSDDLLDDIAELTILKGGKVRVLSSDQMPHGQPIAAILRWQDVPHSNQTSLILEVSSSPHAAVRSA